MANPNVLDYVRDREKALDVTWRSARILAKELGKDANPLVEKLAALHSALVIYKAKAGIVGNKFYNPGK